MRCARASARFLLIAIAALSGRNVIAAVGEAAASPDDKTAMKYLLNCQGCHQADGSGRPGYIPGFKGAARFLRSPEGRAYLARVPGTAQALLNDGERADVLNWILKTFDSENIPPGSAPYTAAELAQYRAEPLSNPMSERQHLMALLQLGPQMSERLGSEGMPRSPTAYSPASAGQAPPAFSVCAGCHPTSQDGSSAMGPNLRGIVGRRAGTLPGFVYSRAMRDSNIVWTRPELDAFLAGVSKRVPGTLMAYDSVATAADRDLIISYLDNLH
jgi:cytochrome c2